MLFTQRPHHCYQQSLNGADTVNFQGLWNHWQFTVEGGSMFILLYPFTPPFPTHSFYIEMFASKAWLQKSLLCLLFLPSVWSRNIQQKVMQEEIVVPGTNIDKCYCSSINLIISIQTGGYITQRTQRHRWQNFIILGRVWNRQMKV